VVHRNLNTAKLPEGVSKKKKALFVDEMNTDLVKKEK
jgi:hypothetical protein